MTVREDEVLLLLIPKTQQCFPLAGIALEVTQNSKKNLLDTVGSYLIHESGSVLRIADIQRKGFSGESPLKKLQSMLFGVYRIQVELENIKLDFQDLQNLVVEYVERDLFSHCPIFENISTKKDFVITALKKSTSVKEMFMVIEMPDITNCLDML